MSKRRSHHRVLDHHIGSGCARRIILFISIPENRELTNTEVAKRLGLAAKTVRAAKALYRWNETMKLHLTKIKRDGGLQPRAEMNDERVIEYADDMKAGNIFPPLMVYYDGTNYWLADGYHRCEAALLAGIKKFDVEVKMGDRRDAILYAVGANRAHGLRRTNADKRRSVFVLLGDDEWSLWTDSEIGRRCVSVIISLGCCAPR